jgi:hypothetical protein
MPKAAFNRAVAPCPKCRNREPKEVVGTARGRLNLYCANCGHDFPLKQGMGVASFLLAALALMVAVVVIKVKVIEQRASKSNTEVVEIDGVTQNALPGNQWVAHDPNVTSGQPIAMKPIPKPKPPSNPGLTQSEKEIRKQWGWGTKGSTLNQDTK